MIDIDLLLAWGATFKKVAKGEIIFLEGAACNFYYQLVSGQVRWVNVNEQGKEFIQTIIDPGECFGELPLFDDGCYVATAIADIDSVIIRLHKPVFDQLLKEHPELSTAFNRLLAHKVRFKITALKAIAGHDPGNRISALLAQLKEEHKNICPNCNQLQLTRQQIADMTGLRVETVIRSMRQMHEKGMLIITRGKVYC